MNKKSIDNLKQTAAITPVEGAVTDGKTKIQITPPNIKQTVVKVVGTTPFMSNAMSSEARRKMKAGQEEGTRARKMKRSRDPKDFNAQFKGSLHQSTEGWYGITSSSFRNAMIDACRTVDMPMTRAKLLIFVIPDGVTADGTQLTRIYGDPVPDERIGKLASGVSDILVRGRFDEWHAFVKFEWDADALSASDIVNLLARAGKHCGVGAGRPNSKQSNGIGMGIFTVEGF
jgi:hypothetical protein